MHSADSTTLLSRPEEGQRDIGHHSIVHTMRLISQMGMGVYPKA